MAPELVVRPAVATDERAIWPLARALATSYEPTDNAFAESFREILGDERAVLLVAVTRPDQLIGYAHALVHPAFHANGPIAWVEELIVDATHRNVGCGRALMQAVERWAHAEHGAAYVALATRRAADFYAAVGYDESATYFKKALPAGGSSGA